MTTRYRIRSRILETVRRDWQLLRATWHWLRAGYYRAALNHVGHTHPDAPLLTARAIDSQRVVNAFLAGGTA